MLPSGTSPTGCSGFRSVLSSVSTSAIRFAEAVDMETMTKIKDTIMRLERMFRQ